MKGKIKYDIVLTSSKILAYLITILGTIVSIWLKEGGVMVATVSAAGIIIAVKTGSVMWNKGKQKKNEI